ncbi:MAG: homogentisate 1,2-dioxygenase [Caldilineae bacterium]|nr:homogentisate 1,2-dioxygenase [Caldilineae bacterium]
MFYQRMGQVPAKRHVQFKKPDGGLYREEVMGVHGFAGIQSILYHHHQPTRVTRVEKVADVRVEYADFGPVRHRMFSSRDLPVGGDAITSRTVLIGNQDITMAVARPSEPMGYFYRNAQNYECIFIAEGSGRLRSVFGTLAFEPGDYLVIPYSVTWQMDFDTPHNRHLVFESTGQVTTPERYRNHYGQLLEHSPFCERDFRTPSELETFDEMGDFEIRVKVRDEISAHWHDHHPFDVVGWDGFVYPWAFNIRDFEPITGRVHQPPPVHQTFEAEGYVICSFVPRLFDYHPEAIPAPYNHANVNSDEVLYYWDGDFMSRKGVGQFDITLHPSGMPHGPHPGTTEASIGKPATAETAVMMDTFRPLHVAKAALALENPDYMYSWLPAEPGGSTADGGKHGTGGAADAAR